MTFLLLCGVLYLGVGLLVTLPVRLRGIPAPHDTEACTTCTPRCEWHERKHCNSERCVVAMNDTLRKECHGRWLGRQPLKLKEWIVYIATWPVWIGVLIICAIFVYVYNAVAFVVGHVDRVLSVKF